MVKPIRRLRLVKRKKFFKWNGIVHEDLHCQENFHYLSSNITITHTKYSPKDVNRNIEIYERAIKKYQLSTSDIFNYARELTIHKQYKKAIKMYEKCLNSPELSLENKTFTYHQLASCYALIGNTNKEQELTLQSFTIDIPQPVFCCRMGELFINNKQYEQAIFWYELAINIKLPTRYEWTVSQQIYQTWLPYKQLALCYFFIQEYEKSYQYIKKTLIYQPDDKESQQNMQIIKNKLKHKN